jgi:hypothetical protein
MKTRSSLSERTHITYLASGCYSRRGAEPRRSRQGTCASRSTCTQSSLPQPAVASEVLIITINQTKKPLDEVGLGKGTEQRDGRAAVFCESYHL